MNLKPHLQRIIAEKISNENKTKSGIEFNAKQEIEKAKVVEISNNLKNDSEINVGDTIFFEPHTIINFNFNNQNLILINYEDILSYIKDN